MESIEITEISKNNEAHTCNCGAESASNYPELDATLIPHEVRHAAIFGALDSLKVGAGMILLAPHKPVPLLAQLEDRSPGAFEVTFLNEGPEKWHIQFIRQN
ncbi:MAG TPA: DUF2249 domain-containing protein [Candidatus Paceibacterota bacterium]|nr:DUF2249 domain-containing protein [Candidatus Paceibacterota bacterium]